LGGELADDIPALVRASDTYLLDAVVSMMYDEPVMPRMVDLPGPQFAVLGDSCRRGQISAAEAIRRAMDAI